MTGRAASSTSAPHARRSLRDLLSGLTPAEAEALLDALSPNAQMSLPWLFEHWALGHQLPPEGDWATWVILGGRGAGKTRAGAEWVRGAVEGAKPGDPGACSRVALVGETLDQAREVMVFGASGLLACSAPDRRPAEIVRDIRRAVWQHHDLALHDVVLAEPGTIPRTTSGKVSRTECRARYRAEAADA